MFDEKNEPVDILADVDKVVPMTPVSAAPSTGSDNRVVRRGPSVLLLFLILAVLGGLGGGGYYFFARGKSASAPIAPVTPTTAEQNVNAVAPNVPAAQPQPADLNSASPQPALNVNTSAVNQSAPMQPVQPSEAVQKPLDSDGDGLSDAEELKLGTNPFSKDTDGDGLSDYDEVMIYHTDPKNPDTDGDGYTDGQEVKSGHNPLGPGMLFQVPSATK